MRRETPCLHSLLFMDLQPFPPVLRRRATTITWPDQQPADGKGSHPVTWIAPFGCHEHGRSKPMPSREARFNLRHGSPARNV